MTLKLNAVNTVSHYEPVVYAYRYIVCLHEYLSLHTGARVCVCVCVSERERESVCVSVSVCVCVCVCVYMGI